MSERDVKIADSSIGDCHANGIDVHYHRSGGNKPPLVALHGLIGSGACLLPMARSLADNFDVILPDARGQGGSSARSRSPGRSDEMLGYLVDTRLRTCLSAFEILAPPTPDWRALVEAFRVPALLITSGRGVVSLETAKELQSLNALVEHVHLADASHGLPYDQPEALSTILHAFLVRHITDGNEPE